MRQRRDEVLNEVLSPLIRGKRLRPDRHGIGAFRVATPSNEHVSIAGGEQGGRPTGITVTFHDETLPDTAAGSKALITAIYSTRARGIF